MSSSRHVLIAAVVVGILLAASPRARCAETATLPLSEALRTATLKCEVTGNGREELRLLLTNHSTTQVGVTIPSGTIFHGTTGSRVVTLRLASISVPGKNSVESQIPTASLSAQAVPASQAFSATADKEEKLAGLLTFLATNDDIPRATSQLVVLALLEDITFAQWQTLTNSAKVPGSHPAGEVVRAIDAAGLLKVLAPERAFALTADNDLKLRALRNPQTRAKAVQLYGIALPDEPVSAGQELPSLRQLLHTQPGDNCPTCLMRERAGRGAGDL